MMISALATPKGWILNWQGLDQWQQWALAIGGSLAAALIVWLCKRLLWSGRKSQKVVSEAVQQTNVQQNASPVMTQNFQPTINIHPAVADPSKTTVTEQRSSGGKGGDAKVGGSGTAIGGPGGNAGKYGRGGDGGSAEVQDCGLAAGGAGGSVDSDDLWSPPAQSGYEVAMEARGQPIDPKLRQYGRGGMSPGYELRYGIVEQIREEYFKIHQKQPESALENVNAVPLDYVNQELVAMGVNWRARIVRGLDYEFYAPTESR